MKTHLRVFAIVVFILVIGCGSASAYSKQNTQSVFVNVDGVPRMVSTDAQTVGDLLEELSATIDTDYLLSDYKKTDAVTDMMTISLTSVTEKIVATTDVVPYETVEKSSSDLKPGERRVVQEGKEGQTSIVSKEVYHGDKLVSTEPVETKVITNAVNKVIEVGASNVINGMTYQKAISAKVTAYTPFDAGCNGITATGTTATKGVVAVDPRVIPLGSKVYVPGYGVATAEDTGGAIKGNRIDVCYETKNEAFSWGVQNVTVYVLS
ncbi:MULTISPECIES: G5 and 3D domain-containing protein [Anaerotignum]|uniref:G5 and 3D domain-containing protein n=1 Tax=Anaerotignum TaxID=2039240 RepID=UPI00210B64CA|nr:MULTISPECIES: 3D domain-containing protein [Anaerotignum]MCQ4935643.1 3D domain-containing protein [Anaerotignum propionicum]